MSAPPPGPSAAFDDLPDDVLYGHVLPYLGPRSLLRARRVCRRFRALCERYYAISPWLGRALAECAIARIATVLRMSHAEYLVSHPGDPGRVGAYARQGFLALAARDAPEPKAGAAEPEAGAAGPEAGAAGPEAGAAGPEVGAAGPRAPLPPDACFAHASQPSDLGELDNAAICRGLYPLVANSQIAVSWAFAPYILHWCAAQCRHGYTLATFGGAGGPSAGLPVGGAAAPPDWPYMVHAVCTLFAEAPLGAGAPPSGGASAPVAQLLGYASMAAVLREPRAGEREYWDLLGLGALPAAGALLTHFPCPAARPATRLVIGGAWVAPPGPGQ